MRAVASEQPLVEPSIWRFAAQQTTGAIGRLSILLSRICPQAKARRGTNIGGKPSEASFGEIYGGLAGLTPNSPRHAPDTHQTRTRHADRKQQDRNYGR
jgi:hypothetical protein